MKKIAPLIVLALFGALFMVLSPHTSGVQVRVASFRFTPASVHVGVGGAVTFTNTSKTTHTATCVSCGLDAGDIQPGLSKTVTFPRAGTFTFACRYHSVMRMQVRVGSVSAPVPSGSPSS